MDEKNLARHRHNKAEITAGIERLKPRHRMTVLTVNDLFAIYAAIEMDVDADKEEPLEWVQWEKDSLTDYNNNGLLTSEEGTKIAQSFPQISFLNDRNINTKNASYIYIASTNQQYYTPFDGLKIDKCANHKSTICINQYRAYHKTFNLPQSITFYSYRTIAAIDGAKISIVAVTIHIPFKQLRVVIDVAFLFLEDNTATLLFL